MNILTLTSTLASLARHVVNDMADKYEHGRDVLRDKKDSGVASAASAFDQGSDRLRTLSNLVGAYTSLRALTHAVDAAVPGRRVLDLVGLQRRPSTLSRVAMGAGLVVVGAAVGAGVAVLLTPQTGAQMRREVVRRFRALRRDAENMVQDVEEAAQDAAQTAETTAREAANDVGNAVRGVASQTEGRKAEGSHRARANNPKVSHRTPRS